MAQKELKLEKFLILVCFFLIGVGVGFFLSEIIMNEEVIEVEEEIPMLLAEGIEFYGNLDDESETIFYYFIYNFGDIEAKNVSVICNIKNPSGVVIKSEIFNIGNVASNSYQWEELIMKHFLRYDIDETGECMIEYADGKYLNLLDKISGL